MRKRKYLDRFVVFFFAFLLFFTLFSDSLKKQTIPEVMAMRVKERTFPVTVTSGDGEQYVSSKRELGVFVSALDFSEMEDGGIARTFVLVETDDGYVVRECLVELGEETDGWYEVKSGLGKQDFVVCAMDRRLSDGMRVKVWGK